MYSYLLQDHSENKETTKIFFLLTTKLKLLLKAV